MNILFTRELARRCDADGVTANAVHPGFVASNFAKEGDLGWWGNIGMPLARPFADLVAEGRAHAVYLASSPDVEGITGQYFVKCKVAEARQRLRSTTTLAARLWEISAKFTGAG